MIGAVRTCLYFKPDEVVQYCSIWLQLCFALHTGRFKNSNAHRGFLGDVRWLFADWGATWLFHRRYCGSTITPCSFMPTTRAAITAQGGKEGDQQPRNEMQIWILGFFFAAPSLNDTMVPGVAWEVSSLCSGRCDVVSRPGHGSLRRSQQQLAALRSVTPTLLTVG